MVPPAYFLRHLAFLKTHRLLGDPAHHDLTPIGTYHFCYHRTSVQADSQIYLITLLLPHSFARFDVLTFS